MPHPFRYWLALHPDIHRPIGGVKQMHRLAEALNHLGREARIIQDRASFHPGWFKSNVDTISYSNFRSLAKLRSDKDIVILPETFLAALPTYVPGIPKLIFNQNGSYSFGLKDRDGFPGPDEVLKLYAHSDIAYVLCISHHDEMLLRNAFQLGEHRVGRVINGVETKVFRPSDHKQRVISYMPRKNSKDSDIVAAFLRKQSWFQESSWSLEPINGLPQKEVAKVLKRSLIFLAFGHPEGFGLPIAEAACCGCYVIGYSGLGGRELLQLASDNHSGQEIAYGDWLGFVEACANLHERLNSNSSELLGCLYRNSKAFRKIYNPQRMILSVQTALKIWEDQLP